MRVLENTYLRVEVSENGAELQSIRTKIDDAEWLWQGDPAWWSGRSPLLFPVIGQSLEGKVTIADTSYAMPPHGFTRTSVFQIAGEEDDQLSFVLNADDSTRAVYPFEFRLEMNYRLEDDCLHCLATVENFGEREMPFQFGFHPAFVWPLPHAAGQLHRITLVNSGEPAMYRLDKAGLLQERSQSSPFSSGSLEISSAYFDAGAMIFPEAAGETFIYSADAAEIEMRVVNLPNFALWQKPSAPFLCIEPWQGLPPSVSQGPALRDRGHCAMLPPNATKSFTMALRFRPNIL